MIGPVFSDEDLLSITLTRRQWRAIKAEIGDFWSGANDVLWEELDKVDLGRTET